MAHLHSLHEVDPYFSVDIETRGITYNGDDLPMLIQGDHNSEIFSFEMPRFVEGHDMMLCDLAQVHYINISAENKSIRNIGVYKILDMKIDPEDENTILFTWLVSQNATQLSGSLSFALRFACTSGAKIDYNWSTAVYSSVSIVTSIDNVGTVVEQYADVLEAWYLELIMAENAGVNAINEAATRAKDTVVESIVSNEVVTAALDTYVASIKENETESINNVKAAEAESIANIRSAESDIIAEEREELITEIFERITLNEIPHTYIAEGASF